MCDCIIKISESAIKHLKENNSESEISNGGFAHEPLFRSGDSPRMVYMPYEYKKSVRKKDGTLSAPKKQIVNIFPTHCPFCGAEYAKA